MTEAMQMVRSALGEDAIIVATREENGGKSVRVTAAVEKRDAPEGAARRAPHFEIGSAAAAGIVAGEDDWLQYDEEDALGAVSEKLTDVMLRHGMTDEITDQVVSCAAVLGQEQPDIALTAALEHLFSFRPLSQKPAGTACMMVGPPGAGKTLAVAKLAARSVLAGESVAVVTTDVVRAGGAEQLSSLTRLMNLTLVKASGPKQLHAVMERIGAAKRIFIDTPGLNPFSPEDMRLLARYAAAGDIEPVLVMPAGLDPDESGEIARIYAAVGARCMMPVRLDLARRLGGILAAAHHGGLIFAESSATPKIADGLEPLTPRRLARILMPEAAREEPGPAPAGKPTRQTVRTG